MNNKKLNRLNNILITGTPGTGKTSMATLLCDSLETNYNIKFQVINVGELIHNKKLYTEWNKEYDVPIFDEDKLLDELEPIIEQGNCIIDFHSSSFFPERWFSLVVLLRCNNTELYDRLKARNYSDKKLNENIECEIMEITADEVKESYNSDIVLEIKNEKIEDMKANIEVVMDYYNKTINN